jgi:hypothetical protein
VDEPSEDIDIARNRKPSHRWLRVILCLALLGIFGSHTTDGAAVEIATLVVEQGATPLPVSSCDLTHSETGRICPTGHFSPFIMTDDVAPVPYRLIPDAEAGPTAPACLSPCDIFHPPKTTAYL